MLKGALDALRFSLRNAVAFRRGVPQLSNESKAELFDYLPSDEGARALRRERELCTRYRLDPLRERSTRFDYRENLYVLDVLERIVGRRPLTATKGGSFRVVDVGSKNFCYAFALERYFSARSNRPSRLELLGVELDGYVVYRDLRSRVDYAEAYAAQTGNPNVRFVVADFVELVAPPFDVATMFFPFVTRLAQESWGLPGRFFSPERMFRKAAQLTPGGHLLVVSQTAEERDETARLGALAGLEVLDTQPARCKLVHYHEATEDRQATLLAVR